MRLLKNMRLIQTLWYYFVISSFLILELVIRSSNLLIGNVEISSTSGPPYMHDIVVLRVMAQIHTPKISVHHYSIINFTW